MKRNYKALIVLFLILWVTSFKAPGQQWYTWQENEKVALHPKENTWVIIIPDTAYARKTDALTALGVSADKTYRQYDKVIAWMEDVPGLTLSSLQEELSPMTYISPLFELEGGNFKHSNGELLIRWESGLAEKQIQNLLSEYNLRRIEGERVHWLGDVGLYETLPPYRLSTIEIANRLYEGGFVESAVPNYSYALKRLSFICEPNDLLFSEQWNIERIQANISWGLTTGSGAVIAFFDDGVDLTHEDLAGNLLRDGFGNVVGYNATDRGAQ